jgi:hypothetical protein
VGSAAAALVGAVALGAYVLNDGDGDGGSGGGGSAGSASNEFEVTAPWRLVVRNENSPDGCDVTVTDEADQEQSFEDVYGTKFFQMQTSGTVEWEANISGCLVIQQPGSDERGLPLVWKCCQGDSPAFSANQTVSVEVLDFNGSTSCELDLNAVDDGNTIDFDTAETRDRPVVLETFGESSVYIVDPSCGIRITDGG